MVVFGQPVPHIGVTNDKAPSPELPTLLPRNIRAGPLLLDLFHRDVSVDGEWIGLHPREFEVVWRLAETPRQTVSRQRLLIDVWRLDHDPQTNRVEVNIARIRAKLHVSKLAWLLVTDPAGGYRLEVDVEPASAVDLPDDAETLDSYLHIGNDEAN